jgi:hypothetical protein
VRDCPHETLGHGTTSERLSSPPGPDTAIVAIAPLAAHASYGPESGTDRGVPAIVSVADVAPIDVHWKRRGDCAGTAQMSEFDPGATVNPVTTTGAGGTVVDGTV